MRVTPAAELPDPPSPAAMNLLALTCAGPAQVLQPRFIGVDRIPERGALLVANHTIYAFLDLPYLFCELWNRRQLVLRSLGAHGHYRVPVWRSLLEAYGMVEGTPANARSLMASGQHILVFPGGGGEVLKNRDELYTLLWKQRVGFARLAIECGYPIVPVAALGADEMLRVRIDRYTPGFSMLSGLLQRTTGIPLPPLATGIGPTLIPRPERLYFWIGEPIETRDRDDDAASVRALRDEVHDAVDAGLELLRGERDADPRRSLVHRLAALATGSGRTPDRLS